MLALLPMNQEIIIKPKGIIDDWGKPVPGEPFTEMGHYRYNSTKETVVGNNGEEVVFTANIYLPSNTEVGYDSKVGFTDIPNGEVSKKPIRIQHKRDMWGTPVMLRVVI